LTSPQHSKRASSLKIPISLFSSLH
jgi:hypothetical protein